MRFDDTEIPGVLPTTGYISLSDLPPKDLVSLITKKLISVGASVPTELVRKDFGGAETFVLDEPENLIVIVKNDGGHTISDSCVVAQADNGTTIRGVTDVNGMCVLEMKTRRSVQILISHPSYPTSIVEKVDPDQGISITLPCTENIGSLIIHSTGYIPRLSGRLNPILDGNNRSYLYADNIAIDGGKSQPSNFEVNVPIELEDADGVIVFATVKHIAARVTLLQYTRKN